jgi:hypothetical protein
VKINRILFLLAAITIPQLTMVKLPFANVDSRKADCVLRLSPKLKPDSAAKYQKIAKRYVGNAPAKEFEEAHKVRGYKEAYESSDDLPAKTSREQSNEACSAFLKAKDIR